MAWGPFLERPGKLTGPVSYFEIEASRKVGGVLTSNEVHFVSVAENCIIFKSFETPFWNGKQNSLTGPVITGSFEKQAPDHLVCKELKSAEVQSRPQMPRYPCPAERETFSRSTGQG